MGMANESITRSELKAKMEAAEAAFKLAEEAVQKAIEQRDRLRTACEVFEEMLSGVSDVPASVPAPIAPARPTAKPAPTKRKVSRQPPTKAMTVEERGIQVLEQAGEFLDTQVLIDRMEHNGYKYTGSGRVYDTVYGGMDHARRKGGRVVRVNSKWGLREWMDTETESQPS